MWWLLIPIALLAIAKARQNGVTAATASPANPAAPSYAPTLVVRADPFPMESAPVVTVHPESASTVTDAQENLAVAFNAYSTILRHRLVAAGSGLPITQPSAPIFGGGGSGGGRGGIGCPLDGTEIKPLGAEAFDVEKFESLEWVTVKAGEFELIATPSHLLYTDKGVVTLENLRNGSKVITTKGEREVLSKFVFSTKQTALKIHVPKSHLYFASGILSHNKA